MRSLHVAFCVISSAALIGCASSNNTSTADASGGSTMAQPERGSGVSPKTYLTDFRPIEDDKAVMTVHGMGCPLCAENIDKTLAGIPGVKDSYIDMSDGSVTVNFTGEAHPSRAALAKSIVDSGFTLVNIRADGEGGEGG